METQQTTKQSPKVFIRRSAKALGSTMLVCDQQNPKVFVKILGNSVEILETKSGRPQAYIDVIDLTTGNHERLWLGGQLRHTLTEIGNFQGMKLEINWVGKNEYVDEETGQLVTANSYRAFEIE